MSGSNPLTQNPLLPAQSTLLQPGARFFRLVDALNWLDSTQITNSLQQQVITQTGQITTTQGDVATLQTSIGQIAAEIVILQNQVAAIRNWINTYGASLGGTPI